MIDKHRRHQPGQSETRLVGAGAGISDVLAGGGADRLCAGVGDVRRSRLSAGRRPHLRLSQKYHGRARRRLLRLDGPERRRARRRQAAIRTRNRAGDFGTAGLLRCHRRGGRARSCESAARAGRWPIARCPAAVSATPSRTRAVLISPTMSRWRRRCWRCIAPPGCANGSTARALPPISSRQRSSTPRPAALSPPPRPTRSS